LPQGFPASLVAQWIRRAELGLARAVVVATKANATAALGILSFIEEFSTRKQRYDAPAVPPTSRRLSMRRKRASRPY
jgi:hypothetical protein